MYAVQERYPRLLQIMLVIMMSSNMEVGGPDNIDLPTLEPSDKNETCLSPLTF
jgi:hypothetical protein